MPRYRAGRGGCYSLCWSCRDIERLFVAWRRESCSRTPCSRPMTCIYLHGLADRTSRGGTSLRRHISPDRVGLHLGGVEHDDLQVIALPYGLLATRMQDRSDSNGRIQGNFVDRAWLPDNASSTVGSIWRPTARHGEPGAVDSPFVSAEQILNLIGTWVGVEHSLSWSLPTKGNIHVVLVEGRGIRASGRTTSSDSTTNSGVTATPSAAVSSPERTWTRPSLQDTRPRLSRHGTNGFSREYLTEHPHMLIGELGGHCRWVIPQPRLAGTKTYVPDFLVARINSDGPRRKLYRVGDACHRVASHEGRPTAERT